MAETTEARSPGLAEGVVAAATLATALLGIVIVGANSINVSPTTGSAVLDVEVVQQGAEAASTVDAYASSMSIAIEEWVSWPIHDGVYAWGYLPHLFVALALLVVAVVAGTVLLGRSAVRIAAIGLGVLAVAALAIALLGPRWNAWAVAELISAAGYAGDAAEASARGAEFSVEATHQPTFFPYWLLSAFAALLALFLARVARASTAQAYL